MEDIAIIFYSKYSDVCTNLLDTVNSLPLNIISRLNIESICIDNESIRSRIVNSNDIEINVVPTLLVINNNNIDKYEGEVLFKWIENRVKLFVEPQQTQQEQVQQEQVQQEQVQQEQVQQGTSINDLVMENSDGNPHNMIPVRNGEGNYEMIKAEEVQTLQRNPEKKEEPKGNLMSAALAMQKEREKETENISKNQRPV